VGDDTGEHGEVKASNVVAFGETQRLPDELTSGDDSGARKVRE
jgi:hypothetical protein